MLNIGISEIIEYVMYFVIIFICMYWANKIFKQIIIMKYMKSFTDYYAILQYHMEKAYDIIYKDRVLVYSLDGQKVKDSEFSVIIQDFVNLVIKMIGTSLYNEFIKLYGSEDTFLFNLVEYFNKRYEDDEIRKNTLDEISDTDQNQS
jgi:succinate dehydrogenase flavin-adding protein (antitoxin of CptAB toxin-antitoxin module)